MSRRTFPRITAAGLLTVAMIASPPPTYGQIPYLPRPSGQPVEAVEIAPPPRVKGAAPQVELSFNWTFNEPVVSPTPPVRITVPPLGAATPAATVTPSYTYS